MPPASFSPSLARSVAASFEQPASCAIISASCSRVRGPIGVALIVWGALRNQRYAFTNRFTLVSELLQNARRAGAIVVSMLRKALDAFARLDTELAVKVIQADVDVDTEFKSIMRQLITHMMEDPRTITTSIDIIWIARAVERIGDHAKNVAEFVVYLVHGTDIRHASIDEKEQEVRRNV